MSRQHKPAVQLRHRLPPCRKGNEESSVGIGSTSGWQGTKIERIEVSPIGQITVLQTMRIGGRSQTHAVDADEEMELGKDVAVVIKEPPDRHGRLWSLSPCSAVQLRHHREHQRMAWAITL